MNTMTHEQLAQFIAANYPDALKAEPNGLHAWLAVALARQEAAEHGDQAQNLIDLGFGRWAFAVQRISNADFVGLERNAGVQFRMGAPKAHQVTDSPGHDQIQRNVSVKPAASFPSDPHYDAKAWETMTARKGPGRVVFWNVAGPARP